MFTEQLPPELFASQREFIKVMDANRDFVWWAKTLVTEETKELTEEFDRQNVDMASIFKELADVIYVVAGFYNTMPSYPHEVISQEQNEEMQVIMDDAAIIVSKVCNDLKIPLDLVLKAFLVVHVSNMSKVNPATGEPDRREDGKILKGDYYVAPDMNPIVEDWKVYTTNLPEEAEVVGA